MTTQEGLTARNQFLLSRTKWLVGRTLDYIDLTIPSEDNPKDRYPRKKKIKEAICEKLYEVYLKRMVVLETKVLLGRLDDIHNLLIVDLQPIIIMALNDLAQREQMLQLVQEKIQEVKEQIKKEIPHYND